MLTIVCWKWKGKRTSRNAEFNSDHVNALAMMLRSHCSISHRLLCVTDDPEGVQCETWPLWDDFADVPNPAGDDFPRCYRRLKIFLPETTRAMGIKDSVLSIDLDVVIAHDIAPLIAKYAESDFAAWRTTVGMFKAVYNGSLFYFRPGRLRELWDDFDPNVSPKLAMKNKYFGSDQGWISYKLAGRYPGWTRHDGVYSFTPNLSPIRGCRGALPSDARLIFFNGHRKPWDKDVLLGWPWVADLWPGYKGDGAAPPPNVNGWKDQQSGEAC